MDGVATSVSVEASGRHAKAGRIEPEVLQVIEGLGTRIQRLEVGSHPIGIVRAAIEAEKIACQRGKPGVGYVDGEASLECGNASELPATKDTIRSPVGNVMQAGNRVDVADDQTLTGITGRVAYIQCRDDNVGSANTKTAVLKTRAVVNCMAPCIADYELQPVSHAFGHVRLQRMVAGITISKLRADAAENITLQR